MENYPVELRYSKEHEWARQKEARIAVGVTYHAQDALGAVVYIELPKLGAELKAGQTFGVIESSKAVSELYAPVSGKVVSINDALTADPSSINSAPYDAWLIELEPSAPSEYDALLDAPAYQALLESLK